MTYFLGHIAAAVLLGHVIPNGTYFARQATVEHQGAHHGYGGPLDMEGEPGV